MSERDAAVTSDLAEEEVLSLDGRGAFVQRVDLGIADVLLDRVVLQEAGATEGLQAIRQVLVRTLGADALDDREQQVVDAERGVLVCARDELGDNLVLVCCGVEVHRAQAFGVCLLHCQAATHVGVVRDGHARRCLVGHLGQVSTLNTLLGVIESVEVTGGEGGDCLGADHHSSVLDDVEHLGDAVVDLADQPALCGDAVAAEGDLTCGGDLQAHLVFDVGDEDAVTLAELFGLEVEVRLRDEEQAQALGAGSGAFGASENEVEDVLEQVVRVGRGDEALDALDVPGAVVLLDRLGASGTDVGAGVEAR